MLLRVSSWLVTLLASLLNCCWIVAALERWNDETIRAADEKYDALLLLFTIPENCANCDSYVERFRLHSEEIESWLRDNIQNGTVGLGIMDLRESEATANDLQIEGAPSMVLVKDTYIHEYGGPLNAETLGPWIQRRMEGAITHLKGQEDVTRFEKEYDVAIIAYTNSDGLKVFEQVTSALREIPQYGWVNLEDSKDKRFNKITVKKTGLPQPLEVVMGSNVTEMQLWLLKAQMPLIGEINLSNIHAYLQERRPYVWFVGLRHQFDSVRHSLYPITQQPEFLDKFWWVWLNPTQSEQALHFIEDKLKPERIPSYLMTDFNGPGRFYLRKAFPSTKAEDVAEWLRSVLAGKEKRELVSEETPSEVYDPESKLEKLVTKHLESSLLRTKDSARKDEIVLLVVAPMCQDPCKEMQEVMTKMNKYLVQAQLDRPSCKIRLMIIDSYKNELDPEWNIAVPQFPTVYFYPQIEESVMQANRAAQGDLKQKVGALEKHLYSGAIHDIDFWEWLKPLARCDVDSLGVVPQPKKAKEEGYDEL
eukprot:Gregarina_sp_Pseudo_9__4@NODE_1002_length_1981_cov_28_585994_g939_i0_p1_GENE_NODE_1002_length_1981_cov_28_585994_g939_i0NODE_1002_length_1981_cov_28_585994_g939_i0_p1_ORF_typecomplete_len534_score59_13Thioredoxin_6/PF13848_6/2_7e03Thioredoxin_6/PF13848_6/0_011Thioredoxin_6/PF13848_6/5_6e07Calsequestrin/PF01216_17/1_1e08Thioredoxin/PF00085_20/0_009Thioredoxin/PF00085_20/0_0062OST3_OST6/PF04756_13/0_015OST3_OST6/PF04756_13/1_1e02ART/PF01129_18/0_098DUF1153/PF06627_11/0_18Med25/PF11232_8/1_7e02Med2